LNLRKKHNTVFKINVYYEERAEPSLDELFRMMREEEERMDQEEKEGRE